MDDRSFLKNFVDKPGRGELKAYGEGGASWGGGRRDEGYIAPFMSSLDSGTRTTTAGMPWDSRREITRYTRLRLLQNARWLYNNMGLIKRFVQGTTRYSVGQGIMPIPATDNIQFNTYLDEYFCGWADNKMLVLSLIHICWGDTHSKFAYEISNVNTQWPNDK